MGVGVQISSFHESSELCAYPLFSDSLTSPLASELTVDDCDETPMKLIGKMATEDIEGGGWVDPEMEIRKAVLGRAIFDLIKSNVEITKDHRRDAYRWIFSESVERPYSFQHICDILGLSPRRIRAYIIQHCNKKQFQEASNNGTEAGQEVE